MTQRIKLLPDSVANQIAAGEVIQRPASVLKELIENSVDAHATEIQVIVKDSGRTLIQVIDNGIGMSEMDARMSFERHATSKINKAEDLFNLNTKGFRGEALASIAAISHVNLKTRTKDSELGTEIKIEGSKVIFQEGCQTAIGTSFSVKNLFYNVPARRKFLKSDPVEFKHILEEFQRVCLTHPEISFQLHHNDQEILNLPISNLRQRIVNIMGNNYNNRLVPISENTDIINIEGFIGKPEFARKTRGEQYFFVNDRFIKSGYFHHAISSAYESLIAKEQHPSYFIYFEVDPNLVDVNIHPTKTEVKFKDERSIYAILNASVKKSIGQYHLSPTLDFERETYFEVPELKKGQAIRIPQIQVDPDYNPFNTEKSFSGVSNKPSNSPDGWESVYEIKNLVESEELISNSNLPSEQSTFRAFQLHRKYIFTSIKSGFIFVDQQRAHERILYEKYLNALEHQSGLSQKQLFPETIDLSKSDFDLALSFMEDASKIGLDLEEFGQNTLKINGIPVEAIELSGVSLFEKWMDQIKIHDQNNELTNQEKLARSMANAHGIKSGREMKIEEMQRLIEELFSCQVPYYSPSGLPVIVNISLEELDQKFSK